MAPMVQAVSGIAAAATGPYGVLVVGGCCQYDYNATSLSQLYDAKANVWHVVADMEQFRIFPAAVAIPGAGGLVAVMGGAMPSGAGGLREESGDFNPTMVELYHPDANTWASAGEMSVGRHSCCAALDVHGRVIIAGGSDTRTGRRMKSTEGLDLRMKHAHSLAPLPVALWGASAVSRDGQVLCMGGSAQGGVSTASVFSYDERANRWQQMQSLETPRWCGAACLI
jgi:hypothetical protein